MSQPQGDINRLVAKLQSSENKYRMLSEELAVALEERDSLAATVKALREEREFVRKIIAEAHVASTLPMALKILGPALDLLASPSVSAVSAEEEP